jgi:histidyl-tRNA synthetase
MAKTEKKAEPVAAPGRRPQARLPKGLRDIGAAELRGLDAMLAKIRSVYETYGFEPLETPAFELTEALGKFLPDQDRPNEGVFSFQDEDAQWLSLRYDLTAPLARYVAENFERLPKPFRRYAWGPVWRNEKPGPGRYRQFMQFDADTVGAESVAADAEMCMLAADALEALGVRRGEYVIKVSSRKLLDRILDQLAVPGVERSNKRLIVLRAIDKFDRLGVDGVRALLGSGRKDESGDFTPGAELNPKQIEFLIDLLGWRTRIEPQKQSQPVMLGVVATIQPAARAETRRELDPRDEPEDDRVGKIQRPDGTMSVPDGRAGNSAVLESLNAWMGEEAGWHPALTDLVELTHLVGAGGYDDGRVVIDPSVVRGLEYYTGPVFEAELTFEVKNDDGQPVRFGSVGGGGRYDDLVARFTGEKVPATGFSIGVSRLQAALAALGRDAGSATPGPVVVLVLDRDRIADYQRLVQRLRQPDDGGPPIRAELYLGSAGMKAQMKYADRRGAPCVVIQGSDERARGEVQIKDLVEGAKLAATISDAKAWREGRPAQVSVKEADLVAAVRGVLARQQG